MNLQHKVKGLVGKDFSTPGRNNLTIGIRENEEENKLQLRVVDKRDTKKIDAVVDIEVVPIDILLVKEYNDVRFCAQVSSPEHTITYAMIHRPGTKEITVITGIDIPQSQGYQTKYPANIASLQRR